MKYWLLLLLVVSSDTYGQISLETGPPLMGEDTPLPKWQALHGSFLEPNRFGISYDNTPKRVILEAGYGTDFMGIDMTRIGAEILVWSGLKTLEGFRFPVETADYFFGIYSVSPVWVGMLRNFLQLRTRVSHISSHYVDGTTDSVIGGSSSKFSREFASLEAVFVNNRARTITVSAGIKYIFHQVNNYEPTFQFPIGIDYRILRLGRFHDFTLYASAAAGPSLPVYAAGLVYQLQTFKDQTFKVFAEYHSGHSRYGVDGDKNESGFQLGVRFSPKQ